MATPTLKGLALLPSTTAFRDRVTARFKQTAKYVTDSIKSGTVPAGFRDEHSIKMAYAIDNGGYASFADAAWDEVANDSTIAVAAVDGDALVAGVTTGTVPSDAQLEAAVGAVWADVASR
jgi:hypothetical protein